MIINEELFSLEDKANHLIGSILSSPTYQNYQQKKQEMTACEEATALRKEFTSQKERFEKIAAYGDYAPNYREEQRKLYQIKRQLDLQETVADYRFAESELQTLLDEVVQKVAQTVADDIKIDAGNPFFETNGKGNCHG